MWLTQDVNCTMYTSAAYQYISCKVLVQYTVKPLLSGSPIKQKTSIKRTLSLVLKLKCYISLYNELLFSRHLY